MLMSDDRKLYWIQLVTTFAVLIGLGLVVWELRQSHELVKAQLISDDFLAQIDDQRTIMGENPAEAIMKGCITPRELTPTEWRINQAYLNLFTIRNERNFYLSELSSLGRDNQTSTKLILRRLLGLPLFRSWYEENKANVPPRIGDVAEEIIATSAELPCDGFLAMKHLKGMKEFR